jgi:hypothetical protein
LREPRFGVSVCGPRAVRQLYIFTIPGLTPLLVYAFIHRALKRLYRATGALWSLHGRQFEAIPVAPAGLLKALLREAVSVTLGVHGSIESQGIGQSEGGTYSVKLSI